MFGFRTPAKDLTRKADTSLKEDGTIKMTEGAGPLTDFENPSTSKVRQSIGEIESRQKSPRPKKPERQPQQEEKSKTKATAGDLKLTFPQRTKATSGAVEKSPRQQYKSRTAEAKACLLKAKMKIDQSRNLKTDIKADVLEAVERLYCLVKEAEDARQTGEKPPIKDQSPHDNNTLAAQIKEQSTLLRENSHKLEELKELVERQNNMATYATVTANHHLGTIPQRETLHSVVVASADETETGEEVLNRVRKTVDAKEGWVTVQRVRKAKDRKVILGFKSKDDQNKVKERLKGNHLVVEEIKNKNPLLVLRDVLLVNSDDDVLRALRNQNKGIFHDLDNEQQKVEIKYRRKARNPLRTHCN